MPENDEVKMNTAEQVVSNANIPSWCSGVASAVNETYNYANNNLFYALIPTYYRDYAWKYIRVACQWLDGYVPSLHQGGASGIVATHIGNRLITGLSKQIVGEKLIFKVNDRQLDTEHTSLHFISQWSDKTNLIKSIYKGIGFSLGVGTSLLKLNEKNKSNLWLEAVRFDNCFYQSSFTDEVQEATFLIRNYVDTRQNANSQQFFLVEHRFYKISDGLMVKKLDGTVEVLEKKGDKIPYAEYKVHRISGTQQNNIMASQTMNKSIGWKELPKDIRDMIKRDYSVLKIDEPQRLPFKDLGVFPLINSNGDLSTPTANFGESMLVGIQDDLITYELASSYQIRDAYLGKGTLYLPKDMNIGDLNGGGLFSDGITTLKVNANGTLGNTVGESPIEMLKGVDPNQQQAIVNQFNIRVVEWQTLIDNALKRISVKWGMSPKILSSYLAQGQAQMTATQIDSEDDCSIAFISHTRAYFKNVLNKIIEEVLNYYGYPANVSVDFASPTLVNKDRIIQRATNLLQAGLIDIDEAIRMIYPDLDEEALQRKIDIAKENIAKQQMAQFTEMNDDGTFGNQDILKGTTANNY